MTRDNAQIDEILAGMWEGLNGREPNEATRKKMDELRAEKARNERSRRFDDGWECYCDSCCM